MCRFARILMLSLVHVLCALTGALDVFAQQQHSYWYFGARAGIRFYPDSIVALTDSKIITNEGSASIADRNGRLLFYTDGISIYNALHNVVPNGSGLWGNPSTTQVALIVPRPRYYNEWYIFTADANFGSKGVAYTHIRMDSSGHEGLILEKNEELFAPAAEKLTATLHANGRDFWLIAHEAGNNRYRSYLIDSSGIQTSRYTVSETGIQQTVNWNASNAVGSIKVSTNGKRMAAAILGESAFELYDFNAENGRISNAITLTDTVKFANAYSVEFSPDSRFLYLSATRYPKLHQVFITGNTAQELMESRFEIPFARTDGQTSLQNGPDGRLYIGRAGSYLSVLHFPSLFYPMCMLDESFVDLKGRTCYLGLPNQFHYNFVPDFRYEQNCQNDTVSFAVNTLGVDSSYWDFGDGKLFMTTAMELKHMYANSGTYRIKMKVFFESGMDSVEKELTIRQRKKPTLPADTVLCSNSPFVLSVFDSAFTSYRWSTGSRLPQLSVTQSGIYHITTFDGSCNASDSIRISYRQPPQIHLGADTLICEPDEIVLRTPHFGGAIFYWQQNSSLDSFYTITTPGMYTLKVENECGNATDSLEVLGCACEVFVPTAFSPDGDGLNDLFKAEGCLPELFKLQVYNSWGQRVFYSENISKGWDGKFNGKPAPEGMYAWSVEYTGSARSYQLNQSKKGTVILMR